MTGRRIPVALVLAAAIAAAGAQPAAAASWTLERSPLRVDLLGVLAAGPPATWAFGFGAARWDGRAWRAVPTRRLGVDHALWSGAALSPTVVVAVGQSPVGAQGHGLIARWDGTAWRRIGVLGAVSGLRSVARVPGTSRLWAVGWRGRGSTSVPLVEHRDAAGWRRVPVPVAGAGILNGVASVPPDQTWAVGAASGEALALHRTGTRWTATSLPHAAGVTLNAVAHVRGTRRVIAVGLRTVSGTSHPVAYRWDGARWHAMAIAAGAGAGELDGIVSLAAGDAWAVGSVSAQVRPLAVHWARGPAWTRVPVPEPPGGCGVTLHAIAALPGTRTMWAVGDDGCGGVEIVQHGQMPLNG
jgi:hypothetical protein